MAMKEYHWLHVAGGFREHRLHVFPSERKVRLFDKQSDSGKHGDYLQLSPSEFLVYVHYKGEEAGWTHCIYFRQSKDFPAQYCGMEFGKPVVVCTFAYEVPDDV